MTSAPTRACGLLLCALAATLVSAATTSYEYDALGRLRVVTHDNRTATTYTLDPAGNRTQVTDAPVGPTSAPAWISVPASSSTGDYTVSWGAATGTVLTYELYESIDPSFAGSTRVHNTASRTATFVGKPHRTTYHYRVRACANGDCSGFTAGGNNVDVIIPPPSRPASIGVPGVAPFNYAVSWGESTGVLTAYELYESATPSFSAQTLKYSGVERVAAIRDMPDGTYFYRVRGCGRGGCSDYMVGANGVVVNRAPPAPDMPTNLTKTHVANCAWRATWSAVSGAANYIVSDTLGNEQTVTTLYASVACPINNQFANQPRWVKACSVAGGCGSKAYFP
jgi:YD repeat-containing protein